MNNTTPTMEEIKKFLEENKSTRKLTKQQKILNQDSVKTILLTMEKDETQSRSDMLNVLNNLMKVEEKITLSHLKTFFGDKPKEKKD